MTARILDLSFADYRAAPGVNLSRLKLMEKSPLDYRANVRKFTVALGFGRAIHMAVLEPAEFLRTFVVFDGDKRRKEWKEFKAAHEGKDILGRADYETCQSVAEAVKTHPRASTYFDDGQAEVSILWTHPTGIECKSRLDWLSDDLLLDLKSARDVTDRKFAYQAADLLYHAQMAFYHDAAKSVDGRDRKVVLLAVEKEAPFNVVPYVLPEQALAAGRRVYQDWLLLLTKCLDSGEWPGVAEDEVELHLPEWAFSEMDDATITMPNGMEIAV